MLQLFGVDLLLCTIAKGKGHTSTGFIFMDLSGNSWLKLKLIEGHYRIFSGEQPWDFSLHESSPYFAYCNNIKVRKPKFCQLCVDIHKTLSGVPAINH